MFKILNHKGNISKKKFGIKIITPSFSLSEINYLFFSKCVIYMFCSLLKYMFTTVSAASFSLYSL